jgi:hypothetical protein
MGWPPEKLENMLDTAIDSLNKAINYATKQENLMPVLPGAKLHRLAELYAELVRIREAPHD